MSDLETARRILAATHRIALVGASERTHRESNRIMRYLLAEGFVVHPVNPNVPRILDQPCYASLAEVPPPIDTVVCFRRSAFMKGIAEEAIAAGAKHLWMQLGVVNDEAAEIARRAGLLVVMDRCILIEDRRARSARAEHG